MHCYLSARQPRHVRGPGISVGRSCKCQQSLLVVRVKMVQYQQQPWQASRKRCCGVSSGDGAPDWANPAALSARAPERLSATLFRYGEWGGMMLSSPFPSPLVLSVRTGVLPTCFPRSACLESRRLEGTSRDVTWRGKSCMKPSLILPFPHPPVSACHHCNCMCVCMRWHTTHTHTVGGEIILVRDESCR